MKVVLDLPNIDDQEYVRMGIDPLTFSSDLQEQLKWIALKQLIQIANVFSKQVSGREVYPEGLLTELREFDLAYGKLQRALVDFRKTEKLNRERTKDELEGFEGRSEQLRAEGNKLKLEGRRRRRRRRRNTKGGT